MYALKKKKAITKILHKPPVSSKRLYTICNITIYTSNATMSSPLPPAHVSLFPVPLAMSVENSTPDWLASVRSSCPGLPFLPFVCFDPGQLEALLLICHFNGPGTRYAAGLGYHPKPLRLLDQIFLFQKLSARLGTLLSKRGWLQVTDLFVFMKY